jgi:hypothetical protein
MNAWLELIKYSVRTLNKSDSYTCVTGRPEPQVVSFLLGWTTDTAGMACMIAFFQERTMGNGSSRTLSLLFPKINDHERLKPPRSSRPPSWSSNFASCLSRWGGGGLEFLGNASGCSEGWSFEEMSSSLLQLSSRQMSGSIVTCWCRGVAGQSQGSLPSQARELAREAAEWWAKAGIQSRIY